MNLHEVETDEEEIFGFRRVVEEGNGGLFNIFVDKGNADDAFVWRVDIAAIQLKLLRWLFPCPA